MLAAEKNELDLLPKSSATSEYLDELNKLELDTIEKESISSKKYLTEVEVKQIDPYALYDIYQELELYIKSDKYSEEELNQIATTKIKKSLEVTKSNHTVQSTMETTSSGYEIPGFGELTEAEVELAKRHPIEFANYGACAVQAKNETEKYYGTSQLWQGNGDAFRHSFWNAMLLINLSGLHGPMHGYERAEAWTNAHEQYSTGNDRIMDLYNNYVGREFGYFNWFKSTSYISSELRKMVSQGTMVRIVNGELVATNGVTGK